MTKFSDITSPKLISELGEYALFKDINSSDLKSVLECVEAKVEQYNKNEFLALDEDDVSSAGLILEGSVAMVKEDEHGHQSLITYMKEGDLFGESFSMAHDHTSSVSFKAMTKCTIMYLGPGKILNICKNNCPFHRRLITNLFDCISKKNVSLMYKVDILSRNSVRERIMAYLKNELKAYNQTMGSPDNRRVTILLNKTEMAQYLCVNRSSLLREIALMKQEGLIEVHQHTFTLIAG